MIFSLIWLVGFLYVLWFLSEGAEEPINAYDILIVTCVAVLWPFWAVAALISMAVLWLLLRVHD